MLSDLEEIKVGYRSSSHFPESLVIKTFSSSFPLNYNFRLIVVAKCVKGWRRISNCDDCFWVILFLFRILTTFSKQGGQ
jgi:hypothetical protein